MSISEENPSAEGDRVPWSPSAASVERGAEASDCGGDHEPGVSVPMVAQRYNLNANQVFKWRRLFREPERAAGAGRLVPVVIEGAPGHEVGAAALAPRSGDEVAMGAPASGRMEVVLAGDRRVIVDRSVDPSALARVIAVLERR